MNSVIDNENSRLLENHDNRNVNRINNINNVQYPIENQNELPRYEEAPPAYDVWYNNLGYDVYQDFYEEERESFKGCCGMPLSFWLFLFGIFFFPLWMVSSFFMFDSNPFEQKWARISLRSIMFTAMFSILFGVVNPDVVESFFT